MITHAEISHYKSIGYASLSFGRRNVIVGPNGSGKSNVLDAVYFIRDCASEDVDTAVTKRHGIDSIRQWTKTKPYHITTKLYFKNSHGQGAYKIVISSKKGNYRIIEEEGHWYGPHPRERFRGDDGAIYGQSAFTRKDDGRIYVSTTFKDMQIDRTIKAESDELFLSMLSTRVSILPNILFRPIYDELISFSKYNIYPNTLRTPQLASKHLALAEDGSNLSSILKRINSNRRLVRNREDILAGIKSIMPSVIDFQVRSTGGFYIPVFRVEEANGDIHDFNLSQISDGTLRALGLLTAFYQPAAPTKIGIEEPEQMIHPGALNVLAEAAKDFTLSDRQGNNQIFITTHSPSLLDLFDVEDIIWTRMRKGVTESGPINSRQMKIIKEELFSAGELLVAEGIF